MTRIGLHALVDELPDSEVDTAAALLDAYHRGDRVMIQALTAPLERAEEFERQALAEAAYTPRSGISLEDYEAKHGLA
jgi:hypothetical protein